MPRKSQDELGKQHASFMVTRNRATQILEEAFQPGENLAAMEQQEDRAHAHEERQQEMPQDPPLAHGNPPFAHYPAYVDAMPREPKMTFAGEANEDPDGHCYSFEYWANMYCRRPQVTDQQKDNMFITTFRGKAQRWLAEYPMNYFLTYDSLKAAFLKKFRIFKTPVDIIEILRILPQGDKDIEEYCAHFNGLL